MERHSNAYRSAEEVEPQYGLPVDVRAIGAPYDTEALRQLAETPTEDVLDSAENTWADLPPEPAYVGRPRKDETLSAFQLYKREIYRIPLLEPEQERQLAQRKDSGDTEALRRLIEPHLRLVVDMAKKFAYSGRNIEELVQAGNLGLMRAAELFDYRKGVRLGRYASYHIRARILEEIPEQSHLIRLPSDAYNDAKKYGRMNAEYQVVHNGQNLPFEETPPEPFRSPNQLSYAVQADMPVGSLNTPASPDGSDERYELSDLIADPGTEGDAMDEEVSRNELRAALPALLAQALTLRQRTIVEMRFGLNGHDESSTAEIAKALGIDGKTVKRHESIALQRLQHPFAAKKLRSYL